MAWWLRCPCPLSGTWFSIYTALPPNFTFLLIQFLGAVVAQLIRILPPMWETRIEFLAPGSLAWPRPDCYSQPFGE